VIKTFTTIVYWNVFDMTYTYYAIVALVPFLSVNKFSGYGLDI